MPIITTNNLFQEITGFTYIHGAHSVKFGADLRRPQTDPFQSPPPEAIFLRFEFN